MRLHNNNEELFKEKLKSHGIDPFDAGKVRDITTGNQLKKVIDDLITAKKLEMRCLCRL